jgi:hypothetical protein
VHGYCQRSSTGMRERHNVQPRRVEHRSRDWLIETREALL